MKKKHVKPAKKKCEEKYKSKQEKEKEIQEIENLKKNYLEALNKYKKKYGDFPRGDVLINLDFVDRELSRILFRK